MPNLYDVHKEATGVLRENSMMQNGFYTNYTELKFIDRLKHNIDLCQSFSFSVSFIKKPGLRLLSSNIEAAIARGAKGRIITSTYPEFHLVMQCFRCSIIEGEPVLLEHEAAKWLPVNNPRQVQWLPADLEVLEYIEA